MYLYGHKFKTIAIKGNPVDQSSSKSFSDLIHNIKYEKQFRKWLEVRNDQQTATEAWSNSIINFYSC